MGSSVTPTYRIEMKATGGSYTPAAWNVKRDGRPTEANLTEYVRSFEASTAEGGCNAHLGRVTVWSAKVVRQSTAEAVAAYTGPMFAAV